MAFIRVVRELIARVRPGVHISTEESHSAKNELVRRALKSYTITYHGNGHVANIG